MYKRFCSLFVALLFLSQNSFAQLHGGVRLGLTTSAYSGSESKLGKKYINGPAAGLVLDYEFTDFYALQLEAIYSRKGGGWEVIESGDTYAEHAAIRYVEIPLISRFTIQGATRTKFTMGIGPYLGIAMSGEYTSQDPDIGTNKNDLNFDQFDQNGVKTSKIDLGASLNSGVSINLNRGKVLCDVRYNLGFVKLYTYRDNIHPDERIETTTRLFGFYVSYIHLLWER